MPHWAAGVGRVALWQLGHQALDDLPGGNIERLGGVTNSCLVEWTHGKQRNGHFAAADDSTCVEEHQRMVDERDECELEPTEWELPRLYPAPAGDRNILTGK